MKKEIWKKVTACFLATMFLALATAFVQPISVGALSDEEVKAPSAVLLEPRSGRVLYAKNGDEKRPCASITKVMTLLLVMEAIDEGKISMTDRVTASAHAASMGGSDIWLKEGEVMTVDDMIKATVIMSANDAAVALAEHVAGSEDEFVQRMNQRAKELGMNDTVFKNCNGLDEEGHLTTAHDVALMSAELIKHEKIFDYTLTWIDYVRDGKTQLVNTNKLIRTYTGITGLKTGTTSQAGSCVSATAKRNGLSLVAVVLGSTTTADRFSSAATLLDHGYANWSTTTPSIPELPAIPVTNGMETQVELESASAENLLVPKGMEKDLKCSIDLSETLEAPVEKGQVVGKITFSLSSGEELAQYNVYAKTSVEKISFGSSLGTLFRALLHM